MAAAAFDLLVLGAQVRVLGAGGGVGGFDQGSAQVWVTLAGASGRAFASGFVVAGTDRDPAGGVAVGGKVAHVGAELQFTPSIAGLRQSARRRPGRCFPTHASGSIQYRAPVI